ncbi:MAG TPA: hypothetical protein VN376_08800 [Longilinea sp.]|nr:hypothetical protein [Longilinea sp.]
MTTPPSDPKLSERISQKRPKWFNLQTILMSGVILFFLIVILWSEPIAHLFFPPAPTLPISVTLTVLPGTPTAIPDELIASSDQTNSIILGSVVLVLIIVGGVIGALIRRGPKTAK